MASLLGAIGGRLCLVAGVPATAAYERVVAGVVVDCLWVVVWALGGVPGGGWLVGVAGVPGDG